MSPVDEALDEYTAITERCGLLDRSERGKLALAGAGAKEFLHGQVSNDIEGLRAGRGCYAALLTPKGKMLGDVRVLDTGEELLLDTERVALQELFNTIRRFGIGYEFELLKRTLECGLFSLLGPGSYAAVGDLSLAHADEHVHRMVEIDGIAARAIRTLDGVDLLYDADLAPALSEALAKQAQPVSEGAAETLRIERGRPRYGLDIDESVIPQEAGLNERAVSFTKGCYVGQETVARLFYRGKPNRLLRGLRLTSPAATRDQLMFENKLVGSLGTVSESPRLGWIALALVRREAPPGSTVTVGEDGASAEVVELPFG